MNAVTLRRNSRVRSAVASCIHLIWYWDERNVLPEFLSTVSIEQASLRHRRSMVLAFPRVVLEVLANVGEH